MRHKWQWQPLAVCKNPKGMRFDGRQEYRGELPAGWRQFRDHFHHFRAGVTMQRVTTTTDRPHQQWTHWECEELGGGTAGIGYWLAAAARKPK